MVRSDEGQKVIILSNVHENLRIIIQFINIVWNENRCELRMVFRALSLALFAPKKKKNNNGNRLPLDGGPTKIQNCGGMQTTKTKT